MAPLDWPELRTRCSRCGMEDHTIDDCHAWCHHGPLTVTRLAAGPTVTFTAAVGVPDVDLIACTKAASGWGAPRNGTHITVTRSDDGSVVVALTAFRGA